MILRVLKGVAILGAVAAVAMVVSAIVAVARPANNRQAAPKPAATATPVPAVPTSTSRPVVPTGTSQPVTLPPTVITAPAPPAPPVADPVTSACAHTGSDCQAALLTLINGDRHAHNRAPLLLDMTQTLGIAGAPGHRRCVGTRGHTRAMAKSGRVWHINRRYRHASYPHNICRRGMRSAENVYAASGNEWAAVQTIEQHSMQSRKQRNRLLSPHFTRIGLDLERRGLRVFVTEDFLGP